MNTNVLEGHSTHKLFHSEIQQRCRLVGLSSELLGPAQTPQWGHFFLPYFRLNLITDRQQNNRNKKKKNFEKKKKKEKNNFKREKGIYIPWEMDLWTHFWPETTQLLGHLPWLISSPKLLGKKEIWKGIVFITRITSWPQGFFFPRTGEHGLSWLHQWA